MHNRDRHPVVLGTGPKSKQVHFSNVFHYLQFLWEISTVRGFASQASPPPMAVSLRSKNVMNRCH